MKKFIFLSLLLIVLGAASVKAQVAISGRGESDNPHAAAILDLQSNAKGLLLPHVELQNLEILQVGGSNAEEDLTAIGMIVYNISPNFCEGVYFWNGSQWLKAGKDYQVKATGSGGLTITSVATGDWETIVAGENVTFKLTAPGDAQFYHWYLDNDFHTTTTTPEYTSYFSLGNHEMKVELDNCLSLAESNSVSFSTQNIYPTSMPSNGEEWISIYNGNLDSPFPYAATSEYVQESLVAHYDGLDNIGAGDKAHSMTAETWKNLTGNSNAPDLLLSAKGGGAKPSFDIHAVTLDGYDDYMVTDGNLTLSSYDQITVEVVIRPTQKHGQMLETSTDFNTHNGAFVVNTNHTGYVPMDGASYFAYHYYNGYDTIPRLPGNPHLPGGYHGQDYLFDNSGATLQTHSMTVSAIEDLTGFRRYFNGELLKPYPVPARGTTTLGLPDWSLEEANANAPFGNFPLYVGTRAGKELFWQSAIASLRIYSRKLTATEIGDNHQLDLKRFIAPPKVWIGSQQCENVTVLSPRALTCKVPVCDQTPKAQLDITVFQSNGTTEILTYGNVFTYE
ncbi:MAG: LamG domain-containing protein [Candidatus Symbiothrix sp.]|jgi:hypothetical protein|nr:LamG domain-containing protein [Candidatus Symbiothrix sp.]